MIVLFISECEKKARKRTAKILDCFAERIGSSTWKTRITMEGLKAVKILLAKKASKNTAVACHRIVGRRSTRLMWIVGNKRKFNRHGLVCTNTTGVDKLTVQDNDWIYLELIKILCALASLFHDWGKAWDEFQKKLIHKKITNDYLRHEYISLMLWAAFVRARQDSEWLEELASQNINEKNIIEYFQSQKLEDSVFKQLPGTLSRLIGWLILSHHFLPETKNPLPCQT
jgi:CRISPR-associated endonuclease/helicase Cas3